MDNAFAATIPLGSRRRGNPGSDAPGPSAMLYLHRLSLRLARPWPAVYHEAVAIARDRRKTHARKDFDFMPPGMPGPGQAPAKASPIEGVRNLIAVASGKGGVGKTTVAVNLAIALKNMGASVGLMDADVYGPNVPVMLGTNEQPRALDERTIMPVQAYGLK